jgi:predicted nucleic acid-binding protein
LRYWDASAVVPLVVDEEHSVTSAALLSEDRTVVTWWGSRLECLSALRRREREDGLETAALAISLRLLDDLSAGWHELLPGEELRFAAERALAVHPLRAADALQLAAALTWRGPSVRAAEFVCLDERLREAAEREGFSALPATLST